MTPIGQEVTVFGTCRCGVQSDNHHCSSVTYTTTDTRGCRALCRFCTVTNSSAGNIGIHSTNMTPIGQEVTVLGTCRCGVQSDNHHCSSVTYTITDTRGCRALCRFCTVTNSSAGNIGIHSTNMMPIGQEVTVLGTCRCGVQSDNHHCSSVTYTTTDTRGCRALCRFCSHKQ